jgi:hypothetical protein
MQGMSRDTPRRLRPKRYGLRTLAYLTLALASIIASTVLQSKGIKSYGLLTFVGLMVGLIGASVCSVRGIKAGWQGYSRR